MDRATEIASDFTIGRYTELRGSLDVPTSDTAEWREVLKAFRRRIRERFLGPIAELARHDKKEELRNRPGAAILALDCLLIDTIQSFREGRVSTGELSPAVSFKSFLKSRWFSDFNSDDRAEFFTYVRNALLHNGETRNDWKIRIDTPRLLEKNAMTRSRTINRRLFHAGVIREFRRLCSDLKTECDTRKAFLRRMDALCGIPTPSFRNVYFAYGSNLLEQELKRTSKDAQPVGVGFLPCYQLEFTKHAKSRGGDAASIRVDAARVVWGFIYRMHDEDKEALKKREQGYREVSLLVWLKDEQQYTPQKVFTFVGQSACPKQCGPSASYFDLLLEGAKSRELPETYIEELAGSRRKGSHVSRGFSEFCVSGVLRDYRRAHGREDEA